MAAALHSPVRRHGTGRAWTLPWFPYYGHPHAAPAELYGGAAKAGTELFHAYATAYVIYRGCRWTVALRPVYQGDGWDAIVRDLLRQAVRAGVKARLVLLDRGFYSVAVIRYLPAARHPLILPVVPPGRPPRHRRGPSGTWVFFTPRRSGWDRYTLVERRGRARATVTVGI